MVDLQKNVGLIAMLIVVSLMTTSLSAIAASATVELESATFPVGEALGEEDLSQIQGEGVVAGFWGAVGGAVGGLLAYTVDVYWDRWVDGEDRDWVASDASKATATAAVTGFFTGLAAPTP